MEPNYVGMVEERHHAALSVEVLSFHFRLYVAKFDSFDSNLKFQLPIND
jgi:hypothetical protein